MEQNQNNENVQNQIQEIQEENSTLPKQKIDWSFLSDIETLIEQKNKGKKVRCIVFDTETTGVNHKKDHILELAGVEVEDFKLTGRLIHIYIKPRVFVPKNVQELNHIKYDDYKNFWEYYNQDTKSQLQHFLNLIGNNAYIIAHNATFDYYFLMSELKYWGLPEIPKERFRCTLRIVKKLFKSRNIEVPNNKLITLCDYFHILVNQNEGSFHNGLFDTIMTSKLFIHLYKNFANINDFVIPQKQEKKKYYKENNVNEQDINIKINNMKINDKIKTNNINNGNNNNEIKINEVKKDENKNEIKKDDENNNKQINDNIIQDNKNILPELHMLMKKMNELVINESSKEKKDE